jgi:hypothetical protein
MTALVTRYSSRQQVRVHFTGSSSLLRGKWKMAARLRAASYRGTVLRHVERNPWRANLVVQAAAWR